MADRGQPPGAVHTVVPGDSISSIAFRFGYFPDQLWNDPANAELRARRGDPNVLLPGDRVQLPARRPRTVQAATGRSHRFRRKGVPARFRIQLFLGDEPRAGHAWQLETDSGYTETGTADDRGVVESWLPPDASWAVLQIGPDRAELSLEFGHLDPVEAPSGVEQRLRNLGYRDDDLPTALRAFQAASGLPDTGAPDDVTVRRLTEIHDRPYAYPADGDEP
jgi:N-acetylmuramoyl-L-alanine amidase